jgi:catechol-2,3-dioxygenase
MISPSRTRDLETANKFSAGTLGLTKVMENEKVLTLKTGKSTLFVYRSQYSGTRPTGPIEEVIVHGDTALTPPSASHG